MKLCLTMGSATDVSIHFDGDDNTGLFQPADNEIGVSINGTERVRINASGNVGIRTTAINDALTIDGWIGRTAHNNGGLVGSYNNVGANGAQTNPIYTIGTSYKPDATLLANMYGIGYSSGGSASYVLGNASGWGMYVAADGDARVFLSGADNGRSYIGETTGYRLGVGTSSPGSTFHINGDFYNQELVGANKYNSDQTIAWDAAATEIDIGTTGNYVRIAKNDGSGADNSSILIVASVTASGNTIRFADGLGGYQEEFVFLMNGVATFTVTLQRRIGTGAWTTLIRQSATVGLGIGDWYSQVNNIANMQGKRGDEFRFPNSVSLSYFDDPANGNVDYRLLFTPGGSRKNAGNYLISDRNLTAVQIKR